MAGFMVAVFVFGSLSDRIGRRPVILVCLAINVVFGVAIPFSTSYLMFTFLRFFSALGASGGFTTVMEVLGPAHRAILGVAVNLGWSAAYVLLGGLGWLLKDWTYIQLSISVPCVATVLYWWFLPESPRLLLTLGKYDEAEMLLRKAMTENGKDISDLKTVLENLMVQIKKENATKTRGTALDLLKTPNMRKKTLNIYLCWFVTALYII
ncbi:organic cation transporter protein-like isoform X2 [Limulus polyphemus]|uniref:Organic cation transporter protein-like isoform X2 n=1 Tax=Limulus polyphemus TaxID=6850 RepID=A0ABM1TJW0_LIMPO|nr:organic cation transporter protein-like isoform X2 [Limulus polyphemus]